MPEQSLEELAVRLREFAAERDWDQFHSPKNLAMALSVEASELLEHFQWLTEKQSSSLPSEKLQQVREEIGDVLIYLTRLGDKLGIDILAAAFMKTEKNRVKYQIDKAKGSAKKIYRTVNHQTAPAGQIKRSSFFRSRPFDCLFFHES
ncbi:MAG: nucleotide pyrophosphohydrolase [Deltaproteobacteria bacterium]|nr:MAG: nucleotide pyrophosphohydrolase [Deltaproteobacteria bacterium]